MTRNIKEIALRGLFSATIIEAVFSRIWGGERRRQEYRKTLLVVIKFGNYYYKYLNPARLVFR